jgi:coenzyme F420-reducing hydrogenase alpha subunit
MILYALKSLLNTLAEVIGYEKAHGGKAVPAGWAEGIDEDTLKEWKKSGMEEWDEAERSLMKTFRTEYLRLYRQVGW